MGISSFTESTTIRRKGNPTSGQKPNRLMLCWPDGTARAVEGASNLDPRPHDQGSVFGQTERLGSVGAQVRRGDEEIRAPCGHGPWLALYQLDLRQEIRSVIDRDRSLGFRRLEET